MRTRALRVLAAASLAAGAIVAVTGLPASGVGPTFTRITTPGHNLIFRYNGHVSPAANTFTVKGTASTDIIAVDIDCMFVSSSGPQAQRLAANVPVSGSGAFTTIASFNEISMGLTNSCRLRAVPTSVDPDNAYLASYSGPILYVNGAFLIKAGPTTYGFLGAGEQGDGIAEVASASDLGTAAVVTVETPAMELRGLANIAPAFVLSPLNIRAGTGDPNGSAIKVDGKNAYLPAAVHNFLNASPQLLGLPQPPLTVSVSRPNNKGDVVITESAPLKRCAPDNTYPPTTTSCTSLVNTGVTFKRVSLLFRGDHQVRVRDTFTSTGGAHSVDLQYVSEIQGTPTGAVGYLFPGRSGFRLAHPGQSVTGLGSKAGTLFVRTDNFAGSDDPGADTFGLSWSKAPQKVLYSGSLENAYALPYSLTIPAHSKRYLGFAYSEHLLTADAKKLAALAVADMMNTPTISSPHSGARIAGHSVTVKGSVSLGANGLPTSVKVNGHAAHLAVNASGTAASYNVTITEPSGRHKVTVTATDSAGNTRSRSITVTDVAA